jgi:hypothetical protein
VRTLVLLSCLVVACDAGEKPIPPAPDKQPAPKVVTTGQPDWSYLPADSDLVISLDVAKLRQSTLWKTYERDVTRLLMPGFADCTYSPLADVTSVTIGLPLKSELGVFVIRGLDRDKTLDCLRTTKPDSPATAAFDGDFVTLTRKARDAVNILTFADAKTMVMQGSTKPTKQTLTEVVKSGAPLLQNAAFVAARRNVQSNAAVTILSRPGSAELAAKWTQMGMHLTQLSGTVNLTDRLDTRFVMVLANADEAKQLADVTQTQLNATKTFFDKADARAQGDTVTFELGMTADQIKSMAGMLTGLQ